MTPLHVLLIVVDSVGSETIVADGLSGLGHSVVIAETVSTAMKRLESESFDACLVHQTAYEDLLKHMRSMREMQPLMSILLLGPDTAEGRRFARWAGADGVLPPGTGLVVDEIVNAVRAFNAQRRSRIRERTAASQRWVLVVDDDEDVVLPTLSEGLRRAGFSVLTATSGEAALDTIHENEVHVLLTDVMMPGLQGHELIDATLRYMPQIVPLVITGYPNLDNAVSALRAGAQDFLVKPVDTEQLVRVVDRSWNRWFTGWSRSPWRLLDRAPITVLLVEDNPADADLVRDLVEEVAQDRIAIVWVRRLSEALERLRTGSFDVVLLDLHLPDSQGLDTFAGMHRQVSDLPILAITGSTQDMLAEQVVLCGAQDYLPKQELTGALLVSRMLYAIDRHEMLNKLEAFARDVRASDVSRRRIIERNADAIVVVSRDGEALFINPAAEALFGRSSKDLLGEHVGFPVSGGTITEIEIVRRGDIRIAEMRIVETEWEGQLALLASIRDITAHKRSEEKLQQLTNELKVANTQLSRLATIDPLTGVRNRRGLEEMLKAELSRAQRDGTRTAALLVDCDEFKAINDTHGHAVGDAALKEVAARLNAATRTHDGVGRIGGDEFLIILPNTRLGEAVLLAERIRLAVAAVPLVRSQNVLMTVSIGVAAITPASDTLEKVLELTRRPLHDSKTEGRDRVSSHPGRRSEVTGVFDGVLCGETLSVRWQPIVRIANERVVGYELLCRGPEGPFKMPNDLFRMARMRKQLQALDLACLRVCLKTAMKVIEDTTDLTIHFNLFPSTLIETPVDALLDLIRPEKWTCKLCMEVSEQEFAGRSEPLAERITALRRSGILVAIDDVGGVPGTVDTVLMLEPDIMKLDRSLIDGVSGDGMKQRLLRRVLQVASVLNIEAIAEGVELREDADMLTKLGITTAQGFLWSKPVVPAWPAKA